MGETQDRDVRGKSGIDLSVGRRAGRGRVRPARVGHAAGSGSGGSGPCALLIHLAALSTKGRGDFDDLRFQHVRLYDATLTDAAASPAGDAAL
jgi:hypothetical protein